jgi:rRNA-processing protein FCF1
MSSQNETENETENVNELEAIKEEQNTFLNHLEEIEAIKCIYNVEGADSIHETLECEYLYYIETTCNELRELINKLYEEKIRILSQTKYE